MLKIAVDVLSKLSGLRRECALEDELLLIPCKDIHTYGMREQIDVAFVSRDGLVLEVHRNVPSRRRIRCAQAYCTIERFSRVGSGWYKPGQKIRFETKTQQERKEKPL